MNFDQYWERLCTKNQQMRNAARMTITVESFKKHLRTAWTKGTEEEKRIADSVSNLFKQFGDFGGR